MDVTTPAVLRAHVESFANNLESVVARLQRRLTWAMDQIKRLNELRERKGTLQPDEEALFRRCDSFIKRLKGADRRRNQAEGHDDSNTFNVLAAEGFLPGYGLEVGTVVGLGGDSLLAHRRHGLQPAEATGHRPARVRAR